MIHMISEYDVWNTELLIYMFVFLLSHASLSPLCQTEGELLNLYLTIFRSLIFVPRILISVSSLIIQEHWTLSYFFLFQTPLLFCPLSSSKCSQFPFPIATNDSDFIYYIISLLYLLLISLALCFKSSSFPLSTC
jgi:hypothetical protein